MTTEKLPKLEREDWLANELENLLHTIDQINLAFERHPYQRQVALTNYLHRKYDNDELINLLVIITGVLI